MLDTHHDIAFEFLLFSGSKGITKSLDSNSACRETKTTFFISYLELPKAVHEKYSCLVSKGNRNGNVLVNTPLQVGRALLANTNGSCRRERNEELI